MKHKTRVVIIFLAFLFSINIAFAEDISQVIFSPESSQVAKPNEAALLTVQLQYEGDSHPTSCMKMFVNSATGEFSSSVSNWKKVEKLTINSNWTKRNFYYKDSMAGNYTITVEVVSGVSCANLSDQEAQFTASQNLIVEEGISEETPSVEPQATPSQTTPDSAPPAESPAVLIESSAPQAQPPVPQPPQASPKISPKASPQISQTPSATMNTQNKPLEPTPEIDKPETEKIAEHSASDNLEPTENQTASIINVNQDEGSMDLIKWIVIILGIGVLTGAGLIFIRRQSSV